MAPISDLWAHWTRRAAGKHSTLLAPRFDSDTGYAPALQDTLAAISELSQVVKDNPDLVEIYLALGNLYRSQGDIERAVQIRNSLIVRPGLDKRIKARAWYELGRDYKRGGFVDRALDAFAEARTLWGEDEAILREMAKLTADSGDFERAANLYAQLNNPIAQAHFLTRLAQQNFIAKDAAHGRKWLNRALKVYPGAVEAWLLKIHLTVAQGEWEKVAPMMGEAVTEVSPELRFTLFEGILHPSLNLMQSHIRKAVKLEDRGKSAETRANAEDQQERQLCEVVLPLVDELPQELLLLYYGALLHIRCGAHARATELLEDALVIQSAFWPARLELLSLGLEEQTFSPVFKVQLEFFISQARLVNRFVCKACGLRREQLFFHCPRCQSWHSIQFRTSLHE